MHASRKVECKMGSEPQLFSTTLGRGIVCLSVFFSDNIGREGQLLNEDVFGGLLLACKLSYGADQQTYTKI